MKRSRLSPRQREYEVDMINRLSDNQQLGQAQHRINQLTSTDHTFVYEQLSLRTQGRLRNTKNSY